MKHTFYIIIKKMGYESAKGNALFIVLCIRDKGKECKLWQLQNQTKEQY